MSEEKVHQVLIADNQFLVVEALKMLVEVDRRYHLHGVAGNQGELYKLLDTIRKGLLIIDYANMDLDGIEGLKNLKRKFPQVSLLILANSISRVEFSELTKLGIRNILYKTADKEELYTGIDSALKGKKSYSDEILDLFLDANENKFAVADLSQLTVSEKEIVKLIVSGLKTKEIASQRNISHHTVNTHRKNIFRKIEVSNATELILHAIKAGWIDNIEYYI